MAFIHMAHPTERSYFWAHLFFSLFHNLLTLDSSTGGKLSQIDVELFIVGDAVCWAGAMLCTMLEVAAVVSFPGERRSGRVKVM